MKITDKITFLTLVLLAGLGINTWVGARQITRVGASFREVVSRDLVLAEIASSLTRRQLEKAVQFERLTSVAEEMAFSQIPESRRQYLMDYVGVLERRFHAIARDGAKDILQAKAMIDGAGPSGAGLPALKRDEIRALLSRIETAHIAYDEVLDAIFGMIRKGDYQLSLEDLEEIQRKEKVLSAPLAGLLEEIRRFTRQSLSEAEAEKAVAERILWTSLAVLVLLSMAVTVWLSGMISRPLKRLTAAARQVGAADFAVDLDVRAHDEIGEVSRAFQAMAAQLDAFQKTLESKNVELALTLEATAAQKRDLEKVNRELDRFVYTVSHDIAAPLMGIAGYATYLQKHYESMLDEKGQRSLSGIKRSTLRLSALITDLLALTRIARIKNPYSRASVGDLVREAVERLEFRIQETGASVQAAEDLPEMVFDAIKIKEVFFNLISNALKFSAGQPDKAPRVEVGWKDLGDAVEFFIKDNGIGIDPRHHEEIFGVFKRLHTAEAYEGTGAGLSIVKNVVEDHGGTVGVRSVLGEGAEFWFTIPKGLSLDGGGR